MSAGDDPRDDALAVRISRPPGWTDSQDFMSALSMVFAGAGMITRNRSMAWPGLAIALSGWINQHPLRTKEGGQGVGPVLFSLGAIVTAYMPMMILQPTAEVQTPLTP